MNETKFPYRAWAEIDARALRHNIALITERFAGSEDRIMAVVKADAYGHGIENMVPLLMAAGVRRFAVATPAEGARVRGLAPDAPIYLLTAATWFEAPDIIEHRLIPLVSDVEAGKAIAAVALDRGVIADIHIDVDTGIGRAGAQPSEIEALLAGLTSIRGIRVTGIATHFARADDDPADAIEQHAIFHKVLTALGPKSSTLEIHSSNSPGVIVLGAEGLHSLIRPGLLLYGIEPEPGMFADLPFQPVLSLRARVLLCRALPGGSTISYGRTYQVPDGGGRYATIGIGYGDGWSRRLSNLGSVLIRGSHVPICGRICMDQLVVDVTDMPGVSVGDVVTLIGADGPNTQTAGGLAVSISATPHELTTCLLPRVPRFVVGA